MSAVVKSKSSEPKRRKPKPRQAGSEEHIQAYRRGNLAEAFRENGKGHWHHDDPEVRNELVKERDELLQRLQKEFGLDAHWLHMIVLMSDAIVGEAVADIVARGGPHAMGTNLLTAVGGAVGTAAKRLLLRQQLQASAWHMAHASEALKLGSDATPVLRAIRELGMVPEYEKAKRDGKIVRGGKRVRPESIHTKK